MMITGSAALVRLSSTELLLCSEIREFLGPIFGDYARKKGPMIPLVFLDWMTTRFMALARLSTTALLVD